MRKIAGYLTKNRSGKDQKIAQSTHENGYIKPRKTFWRNSKQLLKETGENKKKEGDIVFEIYNNKSKNPDGTPRVGKTTVKMESQNLFLLD